MKIAIIIPTHNRQGMVLRAIDSVLNQSYKNFELIVVDNGSTDQTKAWIEREPDPRLKYFFTPKKGVAHARNFGVKQTNCDWICFLDSDDIWRKHKLSEQLRFHDQNRKIFISQTDDVWIRHSKRVNKKKQHQIREGNLFQQSLKLCLICCSSVMIKKSLFLDLGGFDESLPTCEDYDLWLKITAKYPVGFIPKVLVTKFGGHADQLSKSFEVMDRYRIRSLENLLTSDFLNLEQKEWAKKELSTKKEIIEKGKRKRGLNESFSLSQNNEQISKYK